MNKKGELSMGGSRASIIQKKIPPDDGIILML
jgi:hypothetical protein